MVLNVFLTQKSAYSVGDADLIYQQITITATEYGTNLRLDKTVYICCESVEGMLKFRYYHFKRFRFLLFKNLSNCCNKLEIYLFAHVFAWQDM